MKSELVISTHNRPALLRLTLGSIAAAKSPTNMNLRVIIADNNSTEENQSKNRQLASLYKIFEIDYVFEIRQGKSRALHTTISRCEAEYVGFIDDDKKLESDWLEVCARHIREAKGSQTIGLVADAYR